MLGVVTVVFGQIVRVIRLVLRVSWCESQNASLQALFVCVYLDGGNVVSVHAALLRRRRKLWTFGIGNHVSLNVRHKAHKSPVKASNCFSTGSSLCKASGNQTPYRSQNPHLHNYTSPTSPVQSMGCSNVNDGLLDLVWWWGNWMVWFGLPLLAAVGWNTAVVHKRSSPILYDHSSSPALTGQSDLWIWPPFYDASSLAYGWWSASLARGVQKSPEIIRNMWGEGREFQGVSSNLEFAPENVVFESN